MRCLLQLLLLISLASHSVQGCTAPCNGDTSNSALIHQHCDDESGHSHGPVHRHDCCECGYDCCVWVVEAARAGLRPVSPESELLPLPSRGISGRQRSLLFAAAEVPQGKPRSLQCRNCVWLI